MKHIYLFLAALIFTACSKEEGYGPFNLKDGQEVELFVSHRYGAVGDDPLLMPQNASPQLSLQAFNDREPGYDYHVKAKMVAYKGPQMQDGGPMSHLKFIKVISKEKYEGNEPFELELNPPNFFVVSMLALRKEEDRYLYTPDTGIEIQLTYDDEEVEEQLEEIWQYNKVNFIDNNTPVQEPKWRSIRATVTHDPDDFGRAYLIHNLNFKK